MAGARHFDSVRRGRHLLLALLVALLATAPLVAEDGAAGWLRYAPLLHPEHFSSLPSRITVEDKRLIPAAIELRQGLSSMLGRQFDLIAPGLPLPKAKRKSRRSGRTTPSLPAGTITLGPLRDEDRTVKSVDEESYRLSLAPNGGFAIEGGERGVLYGVFHVLEEVGSERPLTDEDLQVPAAPIRWTDEWDNLDGSVERGYAGRSIFFENGHVRQDLTRAGQYARLLASVGINGCNINNVNADLDLLTTEHLKEFARIAAAFRPWGVRMALSVDLTSPQTVGHLASFDPQDPVVIAWWHEKVAEIYALIPDFAGFTVKADSEGRKGPSVYGRSPADAANVLARSLKSRGGVVLYRGFVYNNHLDWKDPKADRARAGVDNFARYDSLFESNVILQIKEGPIDFQAREPVSPLFAAMTHSNMAIEVQTAQEYTGQQRHMVWLPSMWKWVLDTDLRVDGQTSYVKDIVTGHRFMQTGGPARPGGFVSVTNVGLDANWLHHPMAMANLYGFGRLAWDPNAKLEDILDTWTRLTWGNDPAVDSTIEQLQLHSWAVYEGYTGPHGMGTLTNILGYHFGPGIESAERNGWGQWFRAEKDGIGMDRTPNGTGFADQYPPELATQYENLATCPEDLLLFFHHVPYDFKLKNGKTLVQDIYDTHYAAALAAAQYVPQWEALRGKVDPERFNRVLGLFTFQAGHALVWRDAISSWFQRTSGIADDQGRVDHDPGRVEAEAIEAGGFSTVDVTPWETASGGKAAMCREAAGCLLKTTVQQAAGTYDVAVQYFDLWHGASAYTLSVNGQVVGRWRAGDTLPPAQYDAQPDGQDSTRFTVRHVALKPEDVLELKAVPDLKEAPASAAASASGENSPGQADAAGLESEPAVVDYIVVGPDGAVTPQ